MPYYKGVWVNSFGLPVSKPKFRDRTKKENRKRNFYHHAFFSPFKKNSPKNLILMYDVTEKQKKERDWFRRQLKNFSYVMIQKSVWVGPSPLPKEFLDYVKTIGLNRHLKTFKLEKSYSGKDSIFR